MVRGKTLSLKWEKSVNEQNSILYLTQMRAVDNDITCYEDKGFQRTLPRLNRQGKGVSTAFPNDGYVH